MVASQTRLSMSSRCSVTSSDENRSSGNEHTVRSLISVVHDAVRRNITADDDSESATLTFHRCCQSITGSALRRRSGKNVPGKHGLFVSIGCAFLRQHIV